MRLTPEEIEWLREQSRMVAGAAAKLKLGTFCHACQSIPICGYCHLEGCPMPAPDIKP